MKILAQRQGGGRIYLVEVSKGRGRVADLGRGKFSSENHVDSIMARGYWEPFKGNEASVLAKVRELSE